MLAFMYLSTRSKIRSRAGESLQQAAAVGTVLNINWFSRSREENGRIRERLEPDIMQDSTV